MELEEIEQKANEYCHKNFPYTKELSTPIPQAFVAGARWRINSSWHKASEEPEYDRIFIEIRQTGRKGVYSFNMGVKSLLWNTHVAFFHTVLWAYLDDFYPDEIK